jgi:23S rRNA pseudouridine2605 synthase
VPTVPLARALSKLGLLSRREAGPAIRAGRVLVNGRAIRDQSYRVSLAGASIVVDGRAAALPAWRTILFNKPRGVVTTTRDPQHRPTVFDLLGPAARGLKTVGRLDMASTGLLLLTSDAQLANWLTDPVNAVSRTYVVTVRGRIEAASLATLLTGANDRGETLRAARVTPRKVSGRESHLTIELHEGKNREIRRLLASVGHEVTRLTRIGFGPLQLGRLPPGSWREIGRDEIARAFGGTGRALTS